MAWKEQYDRTNRWYERFANLDAGRSHTVESENYIDEVYAFFQNCYHLKDWLKNDLALSATVRSAVEAHVTATSALAICGDLCNALKHFNRTSKRSSANPAFAAKTYGLELTVGSPEPPKIRLESYEVTTTAGPLRAFQIAKDCMSGWEIFLKNHGLV